MKSIKLIVGLFAIVALAGMLYADGVGPYPTANDGWLIGQSTSTKLGFFGKTTAVARPAITNVTPVLATVYTYSSTSGTAVTNVTLTLQTAVVTGDGATNTVVTNVTATLQTASIGALTATATNTIAGFSTTNSFNQLINGLGDTSGLGLFDQQ